MFRIASFLALWFVLGASSHTPAASFAQTPTSASRKNCLQSCHNSYVACTRYCDKIKNPHAQARCVNKCISRWDCCNDICYGKRKTCP